MEQITLPDRIRRLYSLDDQCWVCGSKENVEESGYMPSGTVCKRCSTVRNERPPR